MYNSAFQHSAAIYNKLLLSQQSSVEL